MECFWRSSLSTRRINRICARPCSIRKQCRYNHARSAIAVVYNRDFREVRLACSAQCVCSKYFRVLDLFDCLLRPFVHTYVIYLFSEYTVRAVWRGIKPLIYQTFGVHRRVPVVLCAHRRVPSPMSSPRIIFGEDVTKQIGQKTNVRHSASDGHHPWIYIYIFVEFIVSARSRLKTPSGFRPYRLMAKCVLDAIHSVINFTTNCHKMHEAHSATLLAPAAIVINIEPMHSSSSK